MKKTLLLSLTLLGGFVIGCSEVGFKSIPSQTCVDFNNNEDQTCEIGTKGNTYTVSFKAGQVDILFVNDNSGSMYPEQVKMADAFSNFLDDIDDLDYHIAMTTTEVTNDSDPSKKEILSSAGDLIQFTNQSGAASGKYVISNPLKTSSEFNSNNELFKGTIKRQETLVCDSNNYETSSCPSPDERGIYAMTRAVEKNQHSFLRSGAHLAVIVLSDEDQRSKTEYSSQYGNFVASYAPLYALEDKDYPETFIDTFLDKHSSKTLSVHSVILRPGDTTCKNSQDNGGLLGFYGYLYDQLSYAKTDGITDNSRVVDGKTSSICNSNFSSNLNIAASIVAANANKQIVQMKCLPEADTIKVTSSQNVNYTLNASDNTLVFTNLPLGVEVKVSYNCPNNI